MSYNHAAFLRDCLDSVFSLQGGFDYEVILVDDASTDATPEIVRSYADSRLKYVRHAVNQGAIATGNEGFALARGEFIARIDSDDRYRPDFLLRTVPVLQQAPDVGLVYGDIAMISETGEITSFRNNVRRHGRAARGNELIPLLEENFVPAPATLFRAGALKTVLPIPSHLRFIDWYLTLGVAENWNFHFIDEVLADYRIHTQNMHRAMIRDRKGEESSRWMIEHSLAQPGWRAEKRAARRRILAAHYLTYADKYFGHVMNAEARRCYLQAVRHCPAWFFRAGIFRRLAATLLPRQAYERIKRLGRPPSRCPEPQVLRTGE
jgi:glycosyltransferase involved in cell wall biosynthesis